MKDIPWLPGYQQSQNIRYNTANIGGIHQVKAVNGKKKGGNNSDKRVGVEFQGLRSLDSQSNININNTNYSNNKTSNNNSSSSSSRSSSSSSSSSSSTNKKKKDVLQLSISLPSISSTNTNNIKSEKHYHENSEIFLKFYTWLFEMFLNPLINTSFYVTEAEGRGAEVHYYRKGVWNRILKKAKQQMGDHFMKIVNHSILPPTVPPILPHPGAKACGNKEWLQQGDQSNTKKQYDNLNSSQINRSRDLLSTIADKGSMKVNSRLPTDFISQPTQNSNNSNDNNDNNNNNNNNNNLKLSQQKIEPVINLETAPAVRFVPKKLSVRPITNLKARPKGRNSKDKNR